MKKSATKIIAVALSALLAIPVLAGFDGTRAGSYADTYPWETAVSNTINVNASDLSYGYELRRKYTSSGVEGNAESQMSVWNNGRTVQAEAIRSQVFIKVYVTDLLNPDVPVTYYGPAATNTGVNAVGKKVTSSLSRWIDYPQGAACLGNAIVRRPDLTHATVRTAEYTVGTTGNWGYNSILPPNDETYMVEVGPGGLTYGAPYADDDGLIVMPDMILSEATNGEFGYVSSAMLDAAIVNYAETPEEEIAAIAEIDNQKAEALRSAFAEYYGVDVLSFEDAMLCANQLIHEEGVDGSRQTAISRAGEALAEGIRSGAVPRERALELLGTAVEAGIAVPAESQALGSGAVGSLEAADVSISAASFDSILDIARAKVAIHLPVYAADGVTVIGEVVIDRF